MIRRSFSGRARKCGSARVGRREKEENRTPDTITARVVCRPLLLTPCYLVSCFNVSQSDFTRNEYSMESTKASTSKCFSFIPREREKLQLERRHYHAVLNLPDCYFIDFQNLRLHPSRRLPHRNALFH